VDCSECVRLLAETGKRNAIYMMAIDRLSASPFNKIRHISAIVNAVADEARIDLMLAALELERHLEIHSSAELPKFLAPVPKYGNTPFFR
jgi:hypothetical protein